MLTVRTLDYVHVDVFSPTPFGGNSLPVFPDAGGLTPAEMLTVTRELRHFETIFLAPTGKADTVRARVFDLFEELPFAGHPILGAAAVLQQRSGRDSGGTWHFALPGRTVSVAIRNTGHGYFGLLDQGEAEFLGEVDDAAALAAAFGLSPVQIDANLPCAVVSTGLRYLIVPVRPGALEQAHIAADITALVQRHGAQFAVLFDAAGLEIRHWNNDGIVEDIATGSAAGTIGAFRLRYGNAPSGETFMLNQGRFTGRPSSLSVTAVARPGSAVSVSVGGDVTVIGRGSIDLPRGVR